MAICLIAAITSTINVVQVVRIILLVGRSPQPYMDFSENKSWAANPTILVNYSILRTLTMTMFSKGIVRVAKNGYKIQ